MFKAHIRLDGLEVDIKEQPNQSLYFFFRYKGRYVGLNEYDFYQFLLLEKNEDYFKVNDASLEWLNKFVNRFIY